MIHEVTATGATVEEAFANAVKALGAPAEAEVHTEMLETPKKKILGLFGGAPAKARAYYEEPDTPKKAERTAEPKRERRTEPKPARPAKQQKPAEAPKKSEQPKKAEPKPADDGEREKIDISSKAGLVAAEKYLREVLTLMGAEKVEIEAFRLEDNEVLFEIDCGDDYGLVIGRRGETLDSIQYLTRLAANRKKDEGDFTRISLNVGNYREKRKHTLSELARKNCQKVLKYGRNVTFEPMNPYERRIIHTTVQEIEGVISYSVGTDAERRVVISLAEGVKPTHPSKGGYNNRGRRDARRQGGPRRSNPSAPKQDAQRAPKTDAGAQGFSLYGKLN